MTESNFLVIPRLIAEQPLAPPTLFLLKCDNEGYVSRPPRVERTDVFSIEESSIRNLDHFRNIWDRDEGALRAISAEHGGGLAARLWQPFDRSANAAVHMRREDLRHFRRLVRNCARQGHAIFFQSLIGQRVNTSDDETVEAFAHDDSGGGHTITVLLHARALRSTHQTAEDIQSRFRHQVVAVALEHAASFGELLPPLVSRSAWRGSEVHRVARELAIQLGSKAFDHGWPLGLLRERVRIAFDLLLRARVGGLGNPADFDPQEYGKETLIIPQNLLADLVAASSDPTLDSRSRLAYEMAFPAALFAKLGGDEAAAARLRQVPDLISEYLNSSWLRYGPISAALARAVLAMEYAQFFTHTLRTPAGILDGSFSFDQESWSYRWSKNARRPWLFGFLRLMPRVIGRILTTVLILVGMTLLEVPHAELTAFTWLVFGGRLRELAFGKRPESHLEKCFRLLEEMKSAWSSIAGKTIAVASFRNALVVSTQSGAVWDASAWQLLADAEARHEAVWRVSSET